MMMGRVETSQRCARRQRVRRSSRKVEWRNEVIVALFKEVRRSRELSADELDTLNRAHAGLGPKRTIWRWTAKDDRCLTDLLARRGHSLRIKPFEVNREVMDIADELGRSYEAVHKRLQRLRRRAETDCPNASGSRKG